MNSVLCLYTENNSHSEARYILESEDVYSLGVVPGMLRCRRPI